MSKILLTLLLLLSIVFIVPFNSYAVDPMDPMQGLDKEVTESTDNPNAMAPPEAETSPTETNADGADKKTIEDYERDDKSIKAERLMDTIMLFLGSICVILPVMYIAIYAGARVNPFVFGPIYRIVTLGKSIPEEISPLTVILRTIPVSVVGILLATGRIKDMLRIIWAFVERHFL